MKIKESPLKLKDFFILNSEFTFNPDEKNGKEIVDLSEQYHVDINFAAPELEIDDFIRLFMKIEINREHPRIPGYSILAEGVGIFTINKNLSENDRQNLLSYSAISMVMNCLRGYISNLTAYAPIGRYLLPSVDVNQLLKDKQNERMEFERNKTKQDTEKDTKQ